MSKSFSQCYDIFETGAGWIGVMSSPAGVRSVTIPQPSPGDCAYELGAGLDQAEHSPALVRDAREAIQGYIDGRVFDLSHLPADFSGATQFMRAAWEACRSIPRGQTRTYGWLAEQAGSPNAPRAAGQAMARNRIPFLVPCHRVIASGGALGGYGRGKNALALKRWLIEMETSSAPAPPPPHWWRS